MCTLRYTNGYDGRIFSRLMVSKWFVAHLNFQIVRHTRPDVVYGHAVDRHIQWIAYLYEIYPSCHWTAVVLSCCICLHFTDIKYSWQVRVVSPRRRITVLRMELQRTRFPISTVGGTGVHRRLLYRRRILRHGRRQIQQVN